MSHAEKLEADGPQALAFRMAGYIADKPDSLAVRIVRHLGDVECATNRQIQHACEAHSGEVARECNRLMGKGLIKRVDGRSGRGSGAVYALAEREFAFPPTPGNPLRDYIARRTVARTISRAEEIEARRVARDPCFMCGTRGDIGCQHREAA